MKTGIKMSVMPEQREEIIRIAKERGLNMGVPVEGDEDVVLLYSKNDVDCCSDWCIEWIYLDEYQYEEVDADLFIRTNGTCEEWTPEPGEMIMVWDVNGEDTAKREFITMTKDGEGFICHTPTGTSAYTWSHAKPAPKDWTELVSEDNPAICWVWDVEEEDKTVAITEEVCSQGAYRFKRKNGFGWQNAKFIMWAKDAE